MPATIRQIKSKYRVTTPRGTKAKKTTKAKAEAQVRLLNAIDHGWQPSKKRRSK